MTRSSRLEFTLFTALALALMCGGFPVKTRVNGSSPPLPNPAQLDIDPGSYYRLTTMWQGDCKSLDIINDGTDNNRPILAKTDDVSGQYWKITPAGGGYFRLTTKWQGESKALDIINDGRNDRPILSRTADVSGQYWRIIPVGDGYYRLQNRWQGGGKSLDIVNDGNNNQPILAPTANVSGQSWKISLASFVSAPPASLRSSFYKQYLDANGIPIISSDKVPPAALYRVRIITLHMLSRIPRVKDRMVRHGARIAVMAKTEVTTDIPEHAFLGRDTSTNWNTRARGLGGTIAVPTGSCAEENVLCYATDNYFGEDIFIHEFAHQSISSAWSSSMLNSREI